MNILLKPYGLKTIYKALLTVIVQWLQCPVLDGH